MKKLLFALALFSIMPLCAMKRENPEKQIPTTMECTRQKKQQELDIELNNLMCRDQWSETGIAKIKDLLKKGANPNAKWNHQTPCLGLSANPRVIRILLDYGADILQPTDSSGNTIFHRYIISNKLLALFLLHAQERCIDFKKIISLKNGAAQTPLSRAERAAKFPIQIKEISADDANSESLDAPYRSAHNSPQKRFLILTDPNTYIPLFFPELVEQFQQDRIDAKLKDTGAPSLYQYLRNRKIGGRR